MKTRCGPEQREESLRGARLRVCVCARPLLATLFETPFTCVVEAGKSGLDRNLGTYTILSYERDDFGRSTGWHLHTSRRLCVHNLSCPKLHGW